MQEVTVHDKTFKKFISEAEIMTAIKEVALEINRDYANKRPLLLPVMNGAFMFIADLIRELEMEPEVDFIRVSSYGKGMESSKQVRALYGLNTDVKGRDIIIVEDIVDTGLTCQFLVDHFKKGKPASVTVATLLYKPDSYQGSHEPDYVGFRIPALFVVGYGLDYAQRGREYRNIYVLKEEEEES